MSTKENPPKLIRKKKIFWVTSSIAEQLGREQVLKASLRELIIYVFFLFFFTFAVIGHKDAYRYYLTQALEEQFVKRSFKTTNDFEINFEQIRTVADFFYYCESRLLDTLYWDYYYDQFGQKIKEVEDDSKKILYENKILGVARMRQLRVRNNSCTIHSYFIRHFRNCYSKYSTNTKDTAAFGAKQGTAWQYSDASTTGSYSFTGEISSYDGSGYYVDLKQTQSESAAIIKELKDGLWVTRHTRAVLIDFSIYNANLNIFAVCKLIFEMPPTGGVVPSHKFHAIYLMKGSVLVYILTIAFIVMLGFYTMEVIRNVMYFRLAYFKQFWSYIEILIITFGISTFITGTTIEAALPTKLADIRNNPTKYGNMEMFVGLLLAQRYLSALGLFFAYIKIFKYISFNRAMNQLNDTLSRCAMDVFGFSLMFFIVFFAFAQLGFILFGTYVENFSTFGISMFTLLRTVLGDFDYYEIEKANRVLAPIYFLSYIFLVFFVLLNMFLAIINDTYSDVKSEIAIAPDEMQMIDYIKKRLRKLFRRKARNEGKTVRELNEIIQHVEDILKKCGYTDLEIAMFFNRYNINLKAGINERHVEKLQQDLNKYNFDQEIKRYNQEALMEGYVHVNEFLMQQKRLEQIEDHIDVLSKNIQELLEKLDKLRSETK